MLVAGLGLLGLSVAVFLASMVFAAGGPHPALQDAAQILRGASIWLLLAAMVVTLAWLLLGWVGGAPAARLESTQRGETPRADDATHHR